MRVDAFQADQVVVDRVFNGSDGIFANVQTQNATTLTELGLFDVGQECIQTFVVETQTVDQGIGLGQAEHARFGIAGLCLGGDRADFHKTKAHGAQAIDAAAVLVQTCRHADAVGELDTRDFDRIAHTLGPPDARQRGVLETSQGTHGQLVRHLWIEIEQNRTGQGVGKQGHVGG